VKRVILLAVAACSGGSKPTFKPTNPNAPGVIWETTTEPWHVLRPGFTAAVEGNRATFGGYSGWVHQFDLATGRPIRERKLDMGSVTSLVPLGGGRILVVGLATADLHAQPIAFTLDDAFEPKKIELPIRGGNPSMVFPRAVRVGDGVVITGAGLPLSVYDSKDFSVRNTLDTAIGWSNVAARGEILLAERNRSLKRFDLSTNGQRDLGYGVATQLVVGDGADIYRVARDSKWIAELARADKTTTKLPDEIDSVHAYDGKRFLTTRRNELRIHELPSGEIKKRLSLEEGVHLSALTVNGTRAVVANGGVVRVIDLETGEITPKTPGARQGHYIAVGNDGVVLAADSKLAWTVAGSKVTATESFAKDHQIEAVRSTDPRHYVTAKNRNETSISYELHTVGQKTPRTLLPGAKISNVWLADDSVLATSDAEGRKQLLRIKQDKPEVLFEFNDDAEVLDLDPGGDVLVSAEGRVAVADQHGKPVATLRVPHCDKDLNLGTIEVGGTRAVTFDPKDLALWDRKTGKLLANVKLGNVSVVSFIPKREEIVLTIDERVIIWSPNKGTRTLRWPGALAPAVSADGKRLAVPFYDGRIGVYDIDALLAATPLGADFPAGDAIAETCGETDPLTVVKWNPDDDPPPPEEEDED